MSNEYRLAVLNAFFILIPNNKWIGTGRERTNVEKNKAYVSKNYDNVGVLHRIIYNEQYFLKGGHENDYKP